MSQLILIFILISTVLFLICFVTIYVGFKMRSMQKKEHEEDRKERKKEHEELKKEMKKEYKHLLANIKNIKDGMLHNLDEKHDKIETVGQSYIQDMKKLKKEHEKICHTA